MLQFVLDWSNQGWGDGDDDDDDDDDSYTPSASTDHRDKERYSTLSYIGIPVHSRPNTLHTKETSLPPI